MAGWKLRKDKTPAEPDAADAPGPEAPDTEIPQAEAFHPEAFHPEAFNSEASHTEAPYLASEAPDMDFEAPARSYNLDMPEEIKEPGLEDSVPHFSSLDASPEAHFTDLDFDSEPEDLSTAPHAEHPGQYPGNHSEPIDGPLTLVDYTEPETAPMMQEFSLHGAQIFEMPPPAMEIPVPIEMPAPIEMPLAAVEAAPPVQAEEAPEEDFPERLRTGRFDRSELASPAPAPHFSIPAVSPFVLDTPVPAAPPAAPQLVVRVGRLSAPFALAKDVTTIGRPDSGLHYYPDVEIEMDDAVSRRHAEVVKRGDSYYLVDTSSTNGTLLNGEKLPPQEERLLAYGDRIRVGDRTEITFE